MPVQPNLPHQSEALLLARLGERLRLERRRQKLSETAVAQRAGIARATVQRAELGAPAVAMGTYLRILAALGHQQDLERLLDVEAHGEDAQDDAQPARRRPAWIAGRTRQARKDHRIRVRDYPQLRQLAWQLKDDAELEPAEALGLYERNWRYVDSSRLTAAERALIERLKNEQGAGVLLV